MTRIQHEYAPNETAKTVKRWERWIDEAPSDMAAQTQLLYNMLLQLRAIKLILAAALLIVPAVIAVAVVIVVNSGHSVP